MQLSFGLAGRKDLLERVHPLTPRIRTYSVAVGARCRPARQAQGCQRITAFPDR
jgi:hypothetical protein